MSQITRLVPTPGPGSGTVTSVSGGNNITITGDPAVNPTVNVSGTTNHAVQVGNATGSLTSIPVGLTGEVLTGVTGGDPVFAAPAASGVTSITGTTGGAQTGAITLSGGTTGLAYGGAAGTITSTFAGITANGGTVNLGTDNTTNAITIGTGTAGRTINIGLSAANNLLFLGTSNGSAATNIQSGSGGLILNSVGGTATLDATSGVSINSTAGALNLGDGANSFAVNIGTAGTRTVTVGSSTSTSSTTIASGTGGANFGTSANAHATTVGSTTAGATTIIQAPSAGMTLTGVQGVAVANKNYVTINTATGAIGSDAGPSAGISTITGDTGGALSGTNITFTGGTTGLSFGGSGTTETLTFAGITANGGTVSLATDATTSTINIGTGAGVKTSTFGSTNSTSTTTVQSGSGALNVTATGGALTINSGVGALGISTDASATTVSLATGGAVKAVTLGSTNTTSSTAIKSGSGNVAINSGLTIDSTGRNKNAVQPLFLASQTGDQSNVTGDGTLYTVTFTNEIVDQNNNFDGTSTFTAPITGNYFFCVCLSIDQLAVAMTNDLIFLVTTGATYRLAQGAFFTWSVAGGGTLVWSGSVIAPMTATDTAVVKIQCNGGTKVVDLLGSTSSGNRTPYFSGYLLC